MRLRTLHYLKEKEYISLETFHRIEAFELTKPFSIHWHIRTLLYLGVSILTSGLGVLIYKNINSIGHLTILALMAVCTAACFVYTFKKAPAFNRMYIKPDNAWLDYVLLFGVLSFLSFEGYLQYQYNIFGVHYGLATLIPSILVLFLAYRFDHQGVLNIGIGLFASSLGLSLSLQGLIFLNDFNENSLIVSGLILSGLFVSAGYDGFNRNFKAHFEFSYYHYALHLAGVSMISASAMWSSYGLWLIPLVAYFYLNYKFSLRAKSFYMATVGSLYSYIVINIVIVRAVLEISSDAYIALFYYFIITGVAFIYLLNKMRKQIHSL